MKKRILKILIVILTGYMGICGLLFFKQEKLIFFPEKLEPDFRFEFDRPFEELTIKMEDGVALNGLLFKADSTKGLIFYLHGNAGSLRTWGEIAGTYTGLGYDIFILDYRGYGKSEGSISSEGQLYKDLQTVYDHLKTRYDESKIIISGYSIGTGPAAKLASDNRAKLLILHAPYYSLTDLMKMHYRFIPPFILRYKFATYQYMQACKMPVVIFHGNQDAVVDYYSSVKLKELFKPVDTLITLEGQEHNGINSNPEYVKALQRILEK